MGIFPKNAAGSWKRGENSRRKRKIDIPADPGKGHGLFDDCRGEPSAELAQRLKGAALSNYGLAGPAFVTHLAKSIEQNAQFKTELRNRVDLVQKELLKDVDGVDGQVNRVARRFAIVAVAGDSARAALNLPLGDGEPIEAARACLKAWMSRRGGSGAQEILTAVVALRDAIETHGQSRFQRLHGTDDCVAEDSDGHPIRDRLGFRYDLKGEAVWGFTSAGLKEALRGVGDFETLVRGLVERGIIREGADRNQLDKKIGGKKWRLYAVIHSSLFNDDQQ